MRLAAECPRCPAPVTGNGTTRECPEHGDVVPLWRACDPSYEAFADYLHLARGLPTWLPWPLPAGWQVSDFGCVGGSDVGPQAGFVSCGGSSELDGVVELTVVSEEPGVGLASRCGQVARDDPGREVAEEAPLTRINVEGSTTSLWSVSTSDTPHEVLDRAVLAGEAGGRWLWLVLRPASATLCLTELGPLANVAELGPTLISVPFGTRPRSW